MVDGGGNHPQESTAILYMSRKCGGRGLRSVETTYKDIKIKAATGLKVSDQLVAHATRF